LTKESGEIQGFFGSLITMDIVRLQSIKDYWKGGSILFSLFGISDLFSRTRFLDIYSNLCFRHPVFRNEGDKLFKISPLISSIILASQFHYTPKRDLSINEAMIAYSGRNALVQYMPAKPIKYGFKTFLLCEVSSGYVLGWRLFTGSSKDNEFGATYKHVEG